MTSYSSPAQIEPDVDARRFPVVGFVQDIEIAVTVQVRDSGLVKTDAPGKHRRPEPALAVALEDPCCGVGMIRCGVPLLPLGHLRGEDVEFSVGVDVGKLKAVPVDHGPFEQVSPGRWITPRGS